jgi:hypothetical protein
MKNRYYIENKILSGQTFMGYNFRGHDHPDHNHPVKYGLMWMSWDIRVSRVAKAWIWYPADTYFSSSPHPDLLQQCCPTFLYIGAHLTDGCGGAGAVWRLQ